MYKNPSNSFLKIIIQEVLFRLNDFTEKVKFINFEFIEKFIFIMPLWGTHDSLSYIRPQFLVIFFRFMCQTQTMTIEQQYDWGARIFDFRLKYRDNRMISGHGVCTFDVNVTSKVEWLYQQNESVAIRFMIETDETDESPYLSYYNDLVEKFSPKIQFIGLIRKMTMETIIPGNGSVGTEYNEEPGMDSNKFPFPLMYAEQYNYKWWPRIEAGEFGIMDFPEITHKLREP